MESLQFFKVILLFNVMKYSLAYLPSCEITGLCSCKMTDGSGVISLADIDNGDIVPRFQNLKISDIATVSYSPCVPFTENECIGVQACYFSKDVPNGSPIGSGQPSSIYMQGSPPSIAFEYNGKQGNTKVNLICVPGKTDPEATAEIDSDSNHVINITSRCACLNGCYKTSPSSQGSGLSLGSTLCIILLVVVVLYLVLGILINKYAREKSGADLIPNKEFWVDLPSLVQEGFVFVSDKVKGGNTQYDAI